MVNVLITDAKLHYCGQIIRRLRREHASAFALVGLNAHRELRSTVAGSPYRKAAFVDGELVAMWGVMGSMLSPFGFVWLCLTNEAVKYPIAIMREARRQLDLMLEEKVELVTTVLHTDQAAIRFCTALGFHCSHEGLGKPAHSRWSRQNLRRHIQENPDIRTPVGNSFAITLGYHAERPVN